jgi:YidC/Oxa1 family membrane protein insertase
MNFDRNTVIGFILLGILFFGFFYYTNRQQGALQKQKAIADSTAHAKDSIARLNKQNNNLVTKFDTAGVAVIDSNAKFPQSLQGSEQLTPIENDVIKVVFTNKGGQPKIVE